MSMFETVKGIAKAGYEKAYQTPGLSRVMAEVEIGYNQHQIDKHERKAAMYKDKIDAYDSSANALDKSLKTLESQAADLQAKGMPGASSLLLQMKKIERHKSQLLNKKDKVKTRFEKRENKVNAYTRERDQVVDRLTSRYESKLRPIEAQMDKVKTRQKELDLEETVMDVRHHKIQSDIDDLTKQQTELLEALKLTGISERKAKKSGAFRYYEEVIANCQSILDRDRENFLERKAKVDDYRARLEAAANPYYAKRDRLNRIKEERPIDFNAKITATPSGAGPAAVEEGPEVQVEGEKMVEAWNKFLADKYGDLTKVPGNEQVDPARFFHEIGLPADTKLYKKDFAKILEAYFKLHNLPADKIKNVQEFVKNST